MQPINNSDNIINVGLTGVIGYERIYNELKRILLQFENVIIIDYGLAEKTYEDRIRICKLMRDDINNNYINYAIFVCSCGLRTLANLANVGVRGYIIRDPIDYLNAFKYGYKYFIFGSSFMDNRVLTDIFAYGFPPKDPRNNK